LAGKNKRALVLTAEFKAGSERFAYNHCYFVPVKDLELVDPGIVVEVDNSANDFNITLSCESLAKNVYLSVDGIRGFFTDNYFDLLPGDPVTVNFVTDEKEKNFAQKLKIISLHKTKKTK
jgi:beta-mannosidase